MNVKRVVIGILVIVVLLVAGYFVYQQFFAPETEVTETTGENGTAGNPNDVSVETNLNQVSAEGQIVPLENAMLSFQSGGQLEEILVSEGEVVEAGTPLMRLDTTDEELAVIQAEAALTQSQANLETAQAGLVAAETGLKAAEVGVQAAEAQLALTSAAPSAEQIAVSEARVASAEAGISSAAGSRAAALEGATAAQIAAAEAQVAAAQAQYLSAQKQYEPITQNTSLDEEDRRQAALQLNAATASLNSAQAALDELLAGPKNSEQVAANSGVAAASSQFDASQAELELLRLGAREEQIAIAETAVSSAEAAVVESQLQLDNAQTAVVQAEAAVAEAEAGLNTALNALEKRTLNAPFAATIANIDVKEGEVMSPGVPVITLADFSGWLVETTDLSEISVVTLESGFEADISIDAFPGETLKGTITDIASASDVVRGDVTYKVTIDLGENPDLPLRWGMTAFMTVDTSQ
jgi:HlyD family secretion protein